MPRWPHPPIRSLAVLVSLFLWGCDTQFQPQFPDEATFAWDHTGVLSSTSGEEKEFGTLYKSEKKMLWSKQGEGWRLSIQPKNFASQGYHKNSIARQWLHKIPYHIDFNAEGIPVRFEGWDSLPKVLTAIDQNPRWRRELLASMDTLHYQAGLRDSWRVFTQILPRGKLEDGQTLPVEELNQSLETMKLDSARFIRGQHRANQYCLDVKAFYHYTDSLPLLVEQYTHSKLDGVDIHARFRSWKWDKSRVDGEWEISLSQKSGLPCYETRLERSKVTLEAPVRIDPETQQERKKEDKVIDVYTHDLDYYVPS